MKKVNTYVCLVDNYRRPSRRRNTCGRYLVGAKSAEEAKSILQAAIGFGSIQVYYDLDTEGICAPSDKRMGYKEMVKVVGDGYREVRHANRKGE